MNTASVAAIAGLGLLASGALLPASAATEVVAFSNPGFQTPAPYAPFVHVIPIAQFDPALGTLTSVTYDADFHASLTVFTGFGMPNPLPPSSPFDPPPGIAYTFAFTDYFAGDPVNLGVSGEVDFTHGGDNPGHLILHEVFSDTAFLPVFVGTGTFDFDGLSSVVTNDPDTARNLALQINATGTITFDFTPVPEPATMALFVFATAALVTWRSNASRRSGPR